MKNNTFSSTKTLKSGWSLFLCMAAMALVIFVNPNGAQSTDRLIVTEVNNLFVAGDSAPIIRLNSNTLPATVAPWALIYGSATNSNTGYTLDSYASPVSPAT